MPQASYGSRRKQSPETTARNPWQRPYARAEQLASTKQSLLHRNAHDRARLLQQVAPHAGKILYVSRDCVLLCARMKTFAERGFPGRLIAVEGLDGSGKSTQIYLLKRWLELQGLKVYFSEWNSSEIVKAATSKGKKR
jgi:hypothetical protein